MRWPLLLSLIACSDAPAPDTGPAATNSPTTSGATPSTTAATLTVQATPAPHVRQVPVFTWEAPDSGRSWISYGLDASLGSMTEEVTGLAQVQFTITGLKAGTDLYYQANTELADGTIAVSEVGELTTGLPFEQQSRPGLLSSESDSEVVDGFVMYSVVRDTGASFVQIVDGEGDIVWSREASAETMITSSRMALNGTDVLYVETHLGTSLDLTTLHRVALNGLTASATNLPSGHHDFVEHPDGTVGYFAYVTDDPNKRASDAILELAEGSTSPPPQPVYDYFTNYTQPYWYICEHVNGWQIDSSYDEWTHSNSLMLSSDGEYYFAMSKFMDALLKIRRADGAVMWQLNGRYGDFTTPLGDPTWNSLGDTTLFSHAHMSHLWETPGDPDWTHCMGVFDNGYHKSGQDFSSAVEVCFNEDTLTAERTFAYPEPDGGFTALMGDVRKLDESYLVAWSSLRRIDEVSFDGLVRWSLDMGPDANGGRVSYLPSM